ncbi:TadE/TadG family type IV pilus assembly protein [Devosia naphthalenivorans]|uniref:TadE/TadG family type IV pilus assembly protein n=1 Tax=Devosia naphthalenivorans TaxID=2082392 RepID=UPI000D386CF3|nr:TadE/TadG family type IV pilus assembly protein [Devosia naphthalenivorans]
MTPGLRIGGGFPWVDGVMRHLHKLLRRFAHDEGGAFAVIFGVMAIVLVALSGAVVDYVALQQARSRAQIALDAAALALQQEIYTTPKSELIVRAAALVRDRIGDTRTASEINDAQVDTKLGLLSFTGELTVPTMFVSLVGVTELSANIFSEAVRGSLDVEVAVVVDVTGSMTDTVPNGKGGYETKISALRTALNQLIDIVVKPEQTPSYSKMAIVPYSVAVNVGETYAPAIRGPVIAPTGISNINWAVANSARSISNFYGDKNKPLTFTTSKPHSLTVNDRVFVSGTGLSAVDGKVLTVSLVSSTSSFQLSGVVASSNTNTNINGTVAECQIATCDLVVTSANHGLKTDDYAYIQGTSLRNYSSNNNYNWIDNNTSEFDDRFIVWQIKNANTNNFSLPDTAPSNGRNYGTLPGTGGTVSCVLPGCQHLYYVNKQGDGRRQEISTCVTERPSHAKDLPPTVSYLGRNYSSDNNPCLSTEVQPLTDNKTILHDLANDLTATGSTAGHIGIGWGWYMVSANFKGPWPAASQPAVGDTKNVIKAVVIMTDGAFNTSYCNGVIAKDSGSGSGNEGNKINCNSPNGDAFTQAKALCAAMHAERIRVYTVAFDVGGIAQAKEIMTKCASEPGFAFDATTGADLSSVFASIGENLSSLRLTR